MIPQYFKHPNFIDKLHRTPLHYPHIGNTEDRQVITPLLLLVADSAFSFCIQLLKPFKNA